MQCNAKPEEPFHQFNKSVLLSSLSKYFISLEILMKKTLNIAELICFCFFSVESCQFFRLH